MGLAKFHTHCSRRDRQNERGWKIERMKKTIKDKEVERDKQKKETAKETSMGRE